MSVEESERDKGDIKGPPFLWIIGLIFSFIAVFHLAFGGFVIAVACGSLALTLFTVSDTRERVSRLERHLNLHDSDPHAKGPDKEG